MEVFFDSVCPDGGRLFPVELMELMRLIPDPSDAATSSQPSGAYPCDFYWMSLVSWASRLNLVEVRPWCLHQTQAFLISPLKFPLVWVSGI
jgi:hypothetical protein